MMTEEGFVMPVGFKFLPTEEQLLSYFLYKKVTRELSPVDTMFVKECDIYGDKDPWQIWDDNGGGQMEAQNSRDLYLFTQLKQINEKNGSRIKRTVGGGTWSADSTVEIYSESSSTKEKVLLGFKKRFGYESKTKQKKERLMGNNNIGWIMFEFSLNPKMLPPSCPNDYVLCLLRKPPISKKRKLLQYYLQEEVQDDDDDQGRAKRLEASHLSSSSSVQQYEGNGEGVSSNCDDDLLVTCPLQQVTTGNIRVLQYDQTASNYYYNTPPPALITSNIGGGSSTDVTNGIFSNSTSLITSDVGGGSTDVTNGTISNSTSSSLITSDVGGGGGGSTAVTNGVSSDSTLASALVQDFLDSLLQDFGSVDEVFPDLFGDS